MVKTKKATKKRDVEAALESGVDKTLEKKRGKRKVKNSASHHKNKKVAVFRYAYYGPLFKFFATQVLDCDYIELPPATRRTGELGTRFAPEDVCAPFKHMMGDWVEALELGADVLVQVGGPCRLGFYGEMQDLYLREAGYEFTMLNFSYGIEHGYVGWAKEVLAQVNPDIDIPHAIRELLACATMLERLDEVRDFYMANAGFETPAFKGAYKRLWQNFLDEVGCATSKKEIDSCANKTLAAMRNVETCKPVRPLRIGIVGEVYTAIDEHSNLGLDEKLMSMGVEVHRMLNFSNRYLHYNEPNMRKSVARYLTHDAGPTTTMTLFAAKKYAEEGFDGIIHAKCSGCTPEIDAMPMLTRLSEDEHIPILFLTYDTETSDTGLMTRLEAFYDMLSMKKETSR
jgi:predicted nucleotide-binding protein (sugar kinase/HSP70/actin superfamily)